MNEKVFAIILTGGMGVRIQRSTSHTIPKQFIEVCEKPLFSYALDTCNEMKDINELYLVINKDYEKRYSDALKTFKPQKPFSIIHGGRTRLWSLAHAIEGISDEGTVVVQNGVSPLTDEDLMRKCIQVCRETRESVSGFVPTYYTTFVRDGDLLGNVIDRNTLGHTVDPQVYIVSFLRELISFARDKAIDEKSVVEIVRHFDKPIHLVESTYENLKVTTPLDLDIASLLIKKNRK